MADDEPGVRLAWIRGDGAESCPSIEALEAEVIARLRRDPFQRPFTQSIEAFIRRDDEGVWVLELRNRSGDGELVGSRRFVSRAADCSTLADVVSLSVSLAIDPDENETPEAPPVPVQSDGRQMRFRVGAVLASDMVPGFSVGPELRFDVQLVGPLYLSTGMLFVPERRSEESPEFGFGLSAASTGLCARAQFGRAFLGGCASLSLGAIHAVVYERAPLQPGAQLYAAADLSVEASVQVVGPLFLAAEIGASLPFRRYRFFVEGDDSTVFQHGFALPRLTLALGVHFP